MKITLDKFMATIKLFVVMYRIGSSFGPWPQELTFIEWLDEVKKWSEQENK